ncbi:MAG: hypothetical protein AB7I13_00160 [Vicinamibacterales bacterium]
MPKPADEPTTAEEWAALLRQRIEESGLSARRFAIDVMRRDERTIRRWANGQSPIPQEAQRFLVTPTRSPWP